MDNIMTLSSKISKYHLGKILKDCKTSEEGTQNCFQQIEEHYGNILTNESKEEGLKVKLRELGKNFNVAWVSSGRKFSTFIKHHQSYAEDLEIPLHYFINPTARCGGPGRTPKDARDLGKRS